MNSVTSAPFSSGFPSLLGYLSDPILLFVYDFWFTCVLVRKKIKHLEWVIWGEFSKKQAFTKTGAGIKEKRRADTGPRGVLLPCQGWKGKGKAWLPAGVWPLTEVSDRGTRLTLGISAWRELGINTWSCFSSTIWFPVLLIDQTKLEASRQGNTLKFSSLLEQSGVKKSGKGISGVWGWNSSECNIQNKMLASCT